MKKAPGVAVNANHLANTFLKYGMLTKSAREQTLRLTPPLIINETEVFKIVETAYKAIGDLEHLNYDIMIGFKTDHNP